MFLTVHATAGAIIGQYCPNVWLSFTLGFISHLLLDAIPHGDDKLVEGEIITTKETVIKIALIALVDGLIACALLINLYSYGFLPLSWPMVAAVAGSIVPDLITGFYLLTKNKFLEKVVFWHFELNFITKKHVSFTTGLIIQILTLLILIIIIL